MIKCLPSFLFAALMLSPFYPVSVMLFQFHGGHGQLYAGISQTSSTVNTKLLNTYHRNHISLAACSGGCDVGM